MSQVDDSAASRAEVLFASHCVRGGDLEALCGEHPELADELRLLAEQRERATGLQDDLAAGALFGRPDPAPAAPPPISGFRCTRFLGRGGMGEVWEAEDLALKRRVALKLLPGGAVDARTTERFRREAEAAARLAHSAVVAVFGVGEHDGRRYIVQELVPGGRTLLDVLEDLRRAGETPAGWYRRVAELFAELADALAAAHSAGIVHRDLKPQNVLIAPDGKAKLADFGLARLLDDASLSRTGEFVGTWLYASPEQVVPDANGVGPESDVFSLGVTLYECLTLRRPFEGDSMRGVALAIANFDPPMAHVLRSRVPRDLSVICAKAIEKPRRARYAAMADLRDDLRRHLAGEPIHARPIGPLGRARRWARRQPARATALAVLAVAVPLLAAALLSTRSALGDAREARRAAEAERDVSDQVSDVLDGLFRAADPWHLGAESPSVRDLVELGVQGLRAGETSLPAARARLAGTLGGVLSTLGDSRGAAELLEESHGLWSELGRADEAVALRVASEYAQALHNLGRGPEARAIAAPLVERWRAGALGDADGYQACITLGSIELAEGDAAAARAALLDALRASERMDSLESFEAIQARCLLADVEWREGRHDAALEWLIDDGDRLQPLLAAGNALAVNNFNMQALVQGAMGRGEEAEALFEAVRAASVGALGPGHPKSLNVGLNLANLLADSGRYEESAALFEELADAGSERLGAQAPEVALARNGLGICLLRLGRNDEGEAVLLDLWREAVEHWGADDPRTAFSRLNLATACWRQGRSEEAAGHARAVLAFLPTAHPSRAKAQRDLAHYERDL